MLRRAIFILGLTLAAVPLHAQVITKPVYDCYVLSDGSDGSGYVVLGIAKDGTFVFKNRFPLPDLNAVKAQCLASISTLQGNDAQPVPPSGSKVDLSVTPVLVIPPPPPSQDELDLEAFQNRIAVTQKLALTLPPDDKRLADLRAQNAADLDAHPDWVNSI